MDRKRVNPNNDKVKMLKEKLSQKRRGVVPNDEKEIQYLSVQLMSQKPQGVAQKYKRLGALESVAINNLNPTLAIIKDACTKHYKKFGATCDLLVSERGPSVKDMSQLNLKKVIHVRFIGMFDDSFINSEVFATPALVARRTSAQNSNSSSRISESTSKAQSSQSLANSSSTLSPASSSLTQPSTPVSISAASFLKMGQALPAAKEIAQLAMEEFDIATRTWCDPVVQQMLVEKEPFSSGGFRNAYRLKCISGPNRQIKYVMKMFKADALATIEDLVKENEETHVRKMVQMHMVARNFARKLESEASEEYGQHFKFEKIYFSFFKGKPVTIEQFMEGTFVKYVNNNGDIVYLLRSDEILKKAETFVHYTWKKSEGTLMVLDIQGCGYDLTDPEIATPDVRNDENNWNFCSGNCYIHAITTFQEEHECNKFCNMLNL